MSLNFVHQEIDPGGDMILGTTKHGFKVKENDYIVICELEIYCIRQDLFELIMKL